MEQVGRTQQPHVPLHQVSGGSWIIFVKAGKTPFPSSDKTDPIQVNVTMSPSIGTVKYPWSGVGEGDDLTPSSL